MPGRVIGGRPAELGHPHDPVAVSGTYHLGANIFDAPEIELAAVDPVLACTRLIRPLAVGWIGIAEDMHADNVSVGPEARVGIQLAHEQHIADRDIASFLPLGWTCAAGDDDRGGIDRLDRVIGADQQVEVVCMLVEPVARRSRRRDSSRSRSRMPRPYRRSVC